MNKLIALISRLNPFKLNPGKRLNVSEGVLWSPEIADNIFKNGRLVDALKILANMNAKELSDLPRLSKLSNWECILPEVLDTDHEPMFYVRFVNELFLRGFNLGEIEEMRRISCDNAGWYNYQMMAWEWCFLEESDLRIGLNDRFKTGDITKNEKDLIESRISYFSSLHFQCDQGNQQK